jgi:hypothetical protein
MKWRKEEKIMSDKYENKEGVHIDVHTDKSGRDHISFYDKDPQYGDHKSIHVDYDSDTGKGNIVDTTSGEKETTSIGCYLTSACMRHYLTDFDDNCYELAVLRWFRDNFVSKEDIEHYYQTAPSIVSAIDSDTYNGLVYDYIYDNVVDYCVKAIENGDYNRAYVRYKNSILSLEETFARIYLQKGLVKTLKKVTA